MTKVRGYAYKANNTKFFPLGEKEGEVIIYRADDCKQFVYVRLNIISLPKIAKNNKMDFFQWSFKEPLKINKFGIPETISNKKVYPNILFIPLVGFDNKLNRLGYGGGYYDRYLSKIKNITKTVKIGVGFSFQKIKKLPINKHDIKLDCVITEKEIIE